MALGFAEKAQISAFQALLFYIIANPITFSVVDSLVSVITGPYSSFKVAHGGNPTGFGLLLHAFVFFLITLALMYV
ncbi:hypothetical protein EB118_04665 [bacterium]|nr:hypothetical protein [Actinomycetota bacterium]NDG29378.1 hypothetical protein [bacterium]